MNPMVPVMGKFQNPENLDVAPSQDASDHQDDITFLIGKSRNKP